MTASTARAAGSGSALRIEQCQSCTAPGLEPVLFLGYLPPVNQLRPIGSRPGAEQSFPAELLFCRECRLVQLGVVVDPKILFPSEYPYTSSTTRILRDNFAQLAEEARALLDLGPRDLVVDIGSNDGNLLRHFAGAQPVQGITPEAVGQQAIEDGIPTHIGYFDEDAVDTVLNTRGQASVITATNVFAHMEDVPGVMQQVDRLLAPRGSFIVECHWLHRLVESLQYDTVYHEHMRYYSLRSLALLLERHGFEVFRARSIETHGGSFRAYAARKGQRPIDDSVAALLDIEADVTSLSGLRDFSERVAATKRALWSWVARRRAAGKRIVGIGAPSRASTLVSYTGLDHHMLEAVFEVPGSHKIGGYLPGTQIPILDEEQLYVTQPDCALLLSWHIAEELAPKLRERGFKGEIAVPLPTPRSL